MKIGKNLIYTAIIAITIVISIVLLLTNQGFDDLYRLILRMRWGWILGALGAMAVHYLMDASVLHSIIKLVEKKQRFGRSFRLAMIGFFFNAVTPFASGGQPVQAYCMAKENIEPAKGISALILKSMFFQVVVFFYTVISFLLKGALLRSFVPRFTTLFLIGAGINAALICLFALVLFDHGITEKIVTLIFRILAGMRIIKRPKRIMIKINDQLAIYRDAAKMYRDNWRAALPIVLMEILRLTAQFSIPYFMYRALETGPIIFTDMLAAMSVVTVLATVFPTPGGSGGAEGIGYIFFRSFFVSTQVVPVVLLWRLFTYYLHIVIGGLVSLFAPERPLDKWREDQQIDRDRRAEAE